MAGMSGIPEIRNAKRRLTRFLKALETVPMEELQDAAFELQFRILEEVPVGKKGKLMESVKVYVSKGNIRVRASVRNPKTGYDYAPIQHENTKFLHRIGKAHFISDPWNSIIPEMQERIKLRLKKELQSK